MRKNKMITSGCIFQLVMAAILFSISPVYGVTYTYDGLDRLIRADYENGQYIEYEYDAGGNLMSISSNISCMKGDINGDGEITPGDALGAYNLSKQFTWTTEELCVGDYNEDGEITPNDALLIYQKSTEF